MTTVLAGRAKGKQPDANAVMTTGQTPMCIWQVTQKQEVVLPFNSWLSQKKNAASPRSPTDRFPSSPRHGVAAQHAGSTPADAIALVVRPEGHRPRGHELHCFREREHLALCDYSRPQGHYGVGSVHSNRLLEDGRAVAATSGADGGRDSEADGEASHADACTHRGLQRTSAREGWQQCCMANEDLPGVVLDEGPGQDGRIHVVQNNQHLCLNLLHHEFQL
mmetsp:Transcript_48027/g.102916  ORF Transcript_48027/g.102916 Transcript_48027/m.102916 type:complete len:221 (+) Transcript_48027:318-980(+)